MANEKGQKLNKLLDIEQFEICVPKSCRIHGVENVVRDPDAWEGYLREQLETREPKDHKPARETGFGDTGWILKGSDALAHARRIHRQFADEFLKLPGVSAVDVGFAVDEARRRFENIPALRIHVSDKRIPYLLAAAGLPDLTSLHYLLPAIAYRRRDPDIRRLIEAGECLPAEWANDLRPWLSRFLEEEKVETIESEEAFLGALDRLIQTPHGSNNRYPVFGVGLEDLGVHIPENEKEGHRRLTICGVPLDVIGAEYRPCVQRTPRRTGVFVDPPGTTVELSDEEQERTGRDRVEPLMGGVSIGSTTDQAGTAAAIVWDRTDGTPCVLGNWHVLAGDSSARIGQPTYQPSRFDGGTANDVVGHLKRWHFGPHGDAALSELDGSRTYASGEILGLWQPISTASTPSLNLEIKKWGRTTGYTEGFVDGVQLIVNIDYGGGLIRRFENQFHIAPLYLGEPVSQPGDSGAMIVRQYEQDTLARCRKIVQRIANEPTYRKSLRSLLEDDVDQLEKDATLEELLNLLEDPTHRADLSKASEVSKSAGSKETNSKKSAAEDQEESLEERLKTCLLRYGVDLENSHAEKKDEKNRCRPRTYAAVGLLFAGDTPGSPLGEFAIASDIENLAEVLDFSLRPVISPRSSFRRLQVDSLRPSQEIERENGRRGLVPGDLGSDPRGQGPTPDPENKQSGGN